MTHAAAMVALAITIGACGSGLGACASPPKPVGMVRGRLVIIDGSSIQAPTIDPALGPSGGYSYPAPGSEVGPGGAIDAAPVPAGSTVTLTPDAGGHAERVPVAADGTYSAQVPPGEYELSGASPGLARTHVSCAGPGTVSVKTFSVLRVDVVCLHAGS